MMITNFVDLFFFFFHFRIENLLARCMRRSLNFNKFKFYVFLVWFWENEKYKIRSKLETNFVRTQIVAIEKTDRRIHKLKLHKVDCDASSVRSKLISHLWRYQLRELKNSFAHTHTHTNRPLVYWTIILYIFSFCFVSLSLSFLWCMMMVDG